MKTLTLADLTNEQFTPRLHDKFIILVEGHEAVEVELIQVTVLGAARQNPGGALTRQPFSLVFRGPRDKIIPQGIRSVEHPELGRLDIFLVPIGPDGIGMCLEAIFN